MVICGVGVDGFVSAVVVVVDVGGGGDFVSGVKSGGPTGFGGAWGDLTRLAVMPTFLVYHYYRLLCQKRISLLLT